MNTALHGNYRTLDTTKKCKAQLPRIGYANRKKTGNLTDTGCGHFRVRQKKCNKDMLHRECPRQPPEEHNAASDNRHIERRNNAYNRHFQQLAITGHYTNPIVTALREHKRVIVRVFGTRRLGGLRLLIVRAALYVRIPPCTHVELCRR